MAARLSCLLCSAGGCQQVIITKLFLIVIFVCVIAAGYGSAQHLTAVEPTVSLQQLQIPQKAKLELEKSRTAYLSGNHADAKKYVEHALKIAPTFANAWAWRAILNWDGKRLEESSADLEKAIAYDPTLALAYAALGATYGKMKRWADAERIVEFGMTINPNLWQFYYEAARSHAAQGKFDEALNYFNKADKLGPHDPDHVAALNALNAAILATRKTEK